MFSLNLNGTRSFDTDVDLAALPTHLAYCLRSVRASKVEIQGDCVAFTGGIFRLVPNWNLLVPFGSGDLTVDRKSRKIHYRVSVRQMVLMVTGMLAGGALFPLMDHVWKPLLLLGVVRFRHFIGRSLATAPRLTRQSTHVRQE